MKTIFIGRLGKDAEVKTSSKGNSFLSFPVAIDEFARGERTTIWANVTYTRNVDNISKYLLKGKQVQIFGNLQCRIYSGKTNGVDEAKIAYDVLAESLDFVGGNSSGDTATQQTTTVTTSVAEENATCGELRRPTVAEPIVATVTSVANDADDDLPF